MKIAVASGKGGTGKSTVAANLALALSRDHAVTLADCDVEEPNQHLFFPGDPQTEQVNSPVPEIETGACNYCGKCGEFCQYGALTVLKDRVLFFPELCHSCGGCMHICPMYAIDEKDRSIGTLSVSVPFQNLRLVWGTLNTGEVLSGKVIAAVKEETGRDSCVILDSAPGTSCPVVAALDGCDMCLLVTESTPFGLHDLELAVSLAEILNIPSGVIINRSDGSDEPVRSFCNGNNIPVLMTIPFDRGIAAKQGRGILFSSGNEEWLEKFRTLGRDCRKLAEGSL
jgi:MinD superfamily P-loop ATPase